MKARPKFKSKVEVIDAVIVHIKGRRAIRGPELRFEVSEDELASRFLDWIVDANVEFTIQSSGLGNIFGWAPIECKPQIEQWFKDNR